MKEIRTYRHEGGYVEKTLDVTEEAQDVGEVLRGMRKVGGRAKSSIEATISFHVTDREDIAAIKDSPKATLRTFRGRRVAEFTESASWGDRASLARWIAGLVSSYEGPKRKLLHVQISGFEGD